MRDPKTHSDNNRRLSERDCHRSTTTQLWNADTLTLSNHTNVSVHCCHNKHTVASSQTLLSGPVLLQNPYFHFAERRLRKSVLYATPCGCRLFHSAHKHSGGICSNRYCDWTQVRYWLWTHDTSVQIYTYGTETPYIMICNLSHLALGMKVFFLSSSMFWTYSVEILRLSLSVSFSLFTVKFSFNSHSGGKSPNWVHSALRPLFDLFYRPRVIVRMQNLVEWRLAGETEVLWENLPQRHSIHHKSHFTRPGLEPGPPRWEASD
jgi:hypothetical protein